MPRMGGFGGLGEPRETHMSRSPKTIDSIHMYGHGTSGDPTRGGSKKTPFTPPFLGSKGFLGGKSFHDSLRKVLKGFTF